MRFFALVLAVSLSLSSLQLGVAQASPVTIEKLEASVNSSLILLSDLLRFRDTLKLRQQLDPLFPGTKVAAEGENAADKDIVDFLIDEKLIEQQFAVTDTEVEQEINSIQANNHIDRSQLKKALTEQGFSFRPYFDLIRTSVSKRNGSIDRDIRTKVTISDDDIKNYFYNHYARTAAVPMAYKIRAISVTLKNYKNATGAHEVRAKRAQANPPGRAVRRCRQANQ